MIWFDVSATMFWMRPPSGTVRTQIELCNQLLQSGDQVSLCAYRGGRFVCIEPQAFAAHVRTITSADHATPEDANATPRSALYRMYGWVSQHGPAPARSALSLLLKLAIRLRIPVDRVIGRQLQPEGLAGPAACQIDPGDAFVSVGADWVPEERIDRIADLRRRGVRTVLCCYDLIPVLLPHLSYQPTVERFPRFLAKMADAADAVMCISEHTKQDLEAYFQKAGATPPKLVTIGLGSDSPSFTAEIGNLDGAIKGEFILYVSTIERRKNHETLYKAYVTIRQKLGKNPPLCVLVGAKGWAVEDFLADIELDPRIQGDFLLLSRASDGELQWLYEHCLFTVFPSLYEGWGLPVAESLNNGKFVLASKASSIPEVGGSFAEYLDPWNAARWAEKIMLYMEDRTLLAEREALIQAEYRPRSWHQTGEDVLRVIHAVSLGTDARDTATQESGPR